MKQGKLNLFVDASMHKVQEHRSAAHRKKLGAMAPQLLFIVGLIGRYVWLLIDSLTGMFTWQLDAGSASN